jgi:hypothetical protein
MPPYTPNKSARQQRKLFALAERGEMSMGEARGKARASKGQRLPERVGRTSGRSGRSR